MWLGINIIIYFIAGYLIYNTALSFIGFHAPFKKNLLPISLLSTLMFISKIIIMTPPIIHTISLVCGCALLINLFTGNGFLQSLFLSLLTLIIIISGCLLFIYPILSKFGINISKIDYEGVNWIILNLGELSIPMLVLFINRLNKQTIINKIITK